MEQVLVGVDGSAAAAAALDWAADLTHRTGMLLTVARVYAPTQAELDPEGADEVRAEQRAEVERWCEEARAGFHPRAMLLDGDPAAALMDAAADTGADLLVTGARGAGGFPHLHLGSVAHHLVHHVERPLAIVPAESPAVEHLVVGVDGSPGSLAAVRVAAELASRLGVAVTAVYAFEPFAEWVPDSDPRSWRHFAEESLTAWTAPIAACTSIDLRVERDIHPVPAINRAVTDNPGAAAVVGTRGVGGFPGLRLGRVPLQIVHSVDAATILVPPPA